MFTPASRTRVKRAFLWTAVTLVMGVVAAPRPVAATASVGWHTSGSKILDRNGQQFWIAGINWYGFETGSEGTNSGLNVRNYVDQLNELRSYGFSTVRIPISNQTWELDRINSVSRVSKCAASTQDPYAQFPAGTGDCCASGKATKCKVLPVRDILAKVVNYAGRIGLHVIIDNHRSEDGNSAQASGLWYTSAYPESAWIRDFLDMQRWTHGVVLAGDVVKSVPLALDGMPTVLGYDLRNEPHTACGRSGCTPSNYLAGASWGSGDGIDPATNPNPNPFTPTCVATGSCHDWRLAAERAGDQILGAAASNNWEYPLLFVEGVSMYPAQEGTHASGPYDGYWWGGELQGINGNATNPGAPVVFNEGGDATTLGPPVYNQLVYSAHDYGPTVYKQSWFNAATCYASGCGASSLVDLWSRHWAFVAVAGGVNPVWPGHASYPWGNTGHAAGAQAPMWIGEFGTGKTNADVMVAQTAANRGSQGQWFQDVMNFIAASHPGGNVGANDPGVPVADLNWTYWSANSVDAYGLFGSGFTGLANAAKQYNGLCFLQRGSLALSPGPAAGQCGSTVPPPGVNTFIRPGFPDPF